VVQGQKNTATITAVVITVCVVILGLGMYLLLGRGNNSKSDNSDDLSLSEIQTYDLLPFPQDDVESSVPLSPTDAFNPDSPEAPEITPPEDNVVSLPVQIPDPTSEPESHPPNERPTPSNETRLQHLSDAMRNTNVEVYITFSWTDGPFGGKVTALERSSGSSKWWMYGANGHNREVFPEYEYNISNVSIAYPGTTTRVYYLFEDGTGYFSEPDGSNRENLMWGYWVN
jgi:hypothetical protein